MSVNIENLSPQQLADLISRANKRKKVLAKRKPAGQVKAAVAKLLKTAGWSFDELFGKNPDAPKPAAVAKKPRAAGKRTLGKVAPKYRHPESAKDTWTGRGKQPRWLAAEIAKGRKLEEFLIG